MIMCVLLCYPVSIRIYYQQGVLFLVWFGFCLVLGLSVSWLVVMFGIRFVCWWLGLVFGLCVV